MCVTVKAYHNIVKAQREQPYFSNRKIFNKVESIIYLRRCPASWYWVSAEADERLLRKFIILNQLEN